NPGPAAGGEDPADAAGRPAGGLEEGGGALDADGQLLAPGLEQRIQRLAALGALEHGLGLVGGQPALALQVFLEPPGADGDVAGEDGDAVVQDIDVAGLVADVDQADDAVHGLGVVDLEGVVQGEGVDV